MEFPPLSQSMAEYYTEGFKNFTPNKANTKIQPLVVTQVHCQWTLLLVGTKP